MGVRIQQSVKRLRGRPGYRLRARQGLCERANTASQSAAATLRQRRSPFARRERAQSPSLRSCVIRSRSPLHFVRVLHKPRSTRGLCPAIGRRERRPTLEWTPSPSEKFSDRTGQAGITPLSPRWTLHARPQPALRRRRSVSTPQGSSSCFPSYPTLIVARILDKLLQLSGRWQRNLADPRRGYSLWKPCRYWDGRDHCGVVRDKEISGDDGIFSTPSPIIPQSPSSSIAPLRPAPAGLHRHLRRAERRAVEGPAAVDGDERAGDPARVR